MASVEADRFFRLFRGYGKAYGRYTVRRQDERGKKTGAARTIHEPYTVEVVEEHLSGGEVGIGVVPLLEDNTCAWGAIDIDVYTIDHAALERQCLSAGLPVVVCRTKSGGAHLYLFLKEPAPAELVRRRLEEWSAVLGHGGCEVFPKQVNRAFEEDTGNWINLPYQGGSATVRYAYRDGKALDLDEFFALAEERAATEADLAVERQAAGEEADLFYEAPPCLQHLYASGGFGEGMRNDGLFNVAVYLRKRYPDDWRPRLNDYNARMCHPPMDHREVSVIEKSASRKEYHYRCSHPPIKSHCQKRTCLARRFGVGDSGYGSNVMIGGLTKFVTDSERDPATWAIEVNGHRVPMSTTELMSPDGFNRRAMEVCNSIPVTMPKPRWQKELQKLLADCDVQELPPEAGPSGMTWEFILQFLTQPQQAKDEAEVLLGKPYRESGYIHFRGRDLHEYLLYRRVSYGQTQADLWHLIRKKGGIKFFRNINGRGVNLWRLPAPDEAEPAPREFDFTKPEESF